MNRTDYLNGGAHITAPHGAQLPQSKLTADDVRMIRALVAERDRMDERRRALTNAAIAEKFGLHVRTIEKVIRGETWGRVA